MIAIRVDGSLYGRRDEREVGKELQWTPLPLGPIGWPHFRRELVLNLYYHKAYFRTF